MNKIKEESIVNKCIVEFQTGNKKESVKKLRKFVDQNPEDIVARYNLALMQSETNKINLARKNYEKIIEVDPNHWKSKFNLYIILIEKKEFNNAMILIDDVLKINENYQPALRDKALVLTNLHKPDLGLKYILMSLKQNPKDYIAINTLGIVYLELKEYSKAEKIFKEAISLNPNYISSYNNLGRCYSLQNNKTEALKLFLKVIEADPNYLDSINNIANVYALTGEYKKSLDFYFKALKISPNNNEILFNIGCTYYYLNEYKQAEKYYNQSYKINPNNNLLKKNISILYLTLNKFKKAWTFFDGRLEIDEFKSKNNFFHNIKNILWNGEEINKNDKILVVKEQGIGDEILYGSMYKDLLETFPSSCIEVEPRLLSIFQRSLNSNNFFSFGTFSKNKEKLKQFDVAIFAGSLGRLFRNNTKDFPKKKYLFPDKQRLDKISKKIKTFENKIKIGISWKSKNESVGEDKSLYLKTLKPILELKNCIFINLQYGDTKNEIEDFFNETNIKIINIEEVDLFNDFEGIACLLNELDLFISVSNSTVHLAGALDVKTWLIKPKNHAVFHYWCQPGNTTPWYRSIKMYSFKDSWEKTIVSIKKDLLLKFKLNA